MDFGCSPLTNAIYAGKSRAIKDRPEHRQWVGKKEDVTDKVIKVMFEHMFIAAQETGYFEYSVEGMGTMSFTRIKEEKIEEEQEIQIEIEVKKHDH